MVDHAQRIHLEAVEKQAARDRGRACKRGAPAGQAGADVQGSGRVMDSAQESQCARQYLDHV